MTIYHVQVGNRTYRVDISGNQLFIDGIKEQAKLIRLNANNLFLLCRDRRNTALHLQSQNGQTYAVSTEGRRVIAQVETGEAKQLRPADPGLANQLLAPMPGMVVSIHVQEGDQVEKGQKLVTQESMKMRMELRSPVAGRVVRISAQPHTQVEKGALLVEIQPDEPEK